MRDAFGGAFFIKLMLIFFALYISFIAIALSYTKAFRVKNSIINYIEEHGDYDTAIQDTIDEYVSGMDYYVSSVGPNSSRVQYSTCNSRGYCVFEKASDEVRGKYYEVITFIEIQLPLSIPFVDSNILVPIKGETRLVGKFGK